MNKRLRERIEQGIKDGTITLGKPGEGFIRLHDEGGNIIYDSSKHRTSTTDEWFSMMTSSRPLMYLDTDVDRNKEEGQ